MKNKISHEPRTWHRILTHKDIMNGYVIYNEQHKVLICKHHQCAILSEGLTRHFREDHPDLSLETRQEIFNYASNLSITKPDSLDHPNEKVMPLMGLKVIQGFCCEYEHCEVVCGTVESVKKHCKLNHAWKGQDGRKWTQVLAQTIYQGNNRRSLQSFDMLTVGTLKYTRVMYYGQRISLSNFYLHMWRKRSNGTKNTNALWMMFRILHHWS
jgi:hypothetical protein